eukprot:24619-Eustigmatos_ZCMA.PRE.1
MSVSCHMPPLQVLHGPLLAPHPRSDVSLENVMLTSRNTQGGHLRAVLIDMGSACLVDDIRTCPLSMFSYRGGYMRVFVWTCAE